MFLSVATLAATLAGCGSDGGNTNESRSEVSTPSSAVSQEAKQPDAVENKQPSQNEEKFDNQQNSQGMEKTEAKNKDIKWNEITQEGVNEQLLL